MAISASAQCGVNGQPDHLEKGIVMSIYAQSALIVFAVLVLAIPLLGIRLIARLG